MPVTPRTIPPMTDELKDVRAIAFDLMDTLIYDPFREAIRTVTGLGPEALERERQYGPWPDFELDLIDEQEYGRRFFKPGSVHKLEIERLRGALFRGYAFLPGAEELLAELSLRRPLFVLSNYPRWYEHLRERFDLDRYVAGHFPSYIVGARKPDPVFYQRVLAELELQAEELLFSDDRQENVQAAAELGMVAWHFTDVEDVRNRLRGIL